MFTAIWGALGGGKLTEYVVLGLVILLLLGGSFGAGYYTCDRMRASATATAAQEASTAAAKAQAKADTKDYKKGLADGQKLAQANLASQHKAAALKATPPVVEPRAPVKGVCPQPTIPAAAMKSLNDPALLGGTP